MTVIKIVATRRQILTLKCTKFIFGWGSAPDPARGAYSAPPDALTGFKGPTCKGRGEEMRKWREGEAPSTFFADRRPCLLLYIVLLECVRESSYRFPSTRRGRRDQSSICFQSGRVPSRQREFLHCRSWRGLRTVRCTPV